MTEPTALMEESLDMMTELAFAEVRKHLLKRGIITTLEDDRNIKLGCTFGVLEMAKAVIDVRVEQGRN